MGKHWTITPYCLQDARQDLEQVLSDAESVEEPVMIPQWHSPDQTVREVLGGAGYEVKMT